MRSPHLVAQKKVFPVVLELMLTVSLRLNNLKITFFRGIVTLYFQVERYTRDFLHKVMDSVNCAHKACLLPPLHWLGVVAESIKNAHVAAPLIPPPADHEATEEEE